MSQQPIDLKQVLKQIIAFVSTKNMNGVEITRTVQRFASHATNIEQQITEVNEFVERVSSELVDDLDFKAIGNNTFRFDLPKQYAIQLKLATTTNTVTIDAKISDR